MTQLFRSTCMRWAVLAGHARRVLLAGSSLALALPLSSQRTQPVRPALGPGTVLAQRKIQDATSAFPSTIAGQDSFGTSVAPLGDLDGDGVGELAVGAPQDDAGPLANSGALWILFLAADGSVASHRKHGGAEGGLAGQLAGGDELGTACASLGDLDGDGITELAVGVPGRGDGQVWILFLQVDGGLKARVVIETGASGLSRFGAALAPLGDIDGNGTIDLAVGAPLDTQDGPFFGALWVLFLDADGSVKAQRKISATRGGFTGDLDVNDQLGTSLAGLGDRDGDGVGELAVGAPGDDDAGDDAGALWVLLLDADGSVKAQHKITAGQGGFTGALDPGGRFGAGACALEDLDGDGAHDLAVGAPQSQSSFTRASAWILLLGADAVVQGQQRIGTGSGGFSGTVQLFSEFGRGLAALGDLDGDGLPELAVGAPGEDAGRMRAGALYVLELLGNGNAAAQHRISAVDGPGITVAPHPRDRYGSAVAGIGDLDGDGYVDLAVGASGDSGSGVASNQGGLWIHLLGAGGAPRASVRIANGAGGFGGSLGGSAEFGASVAPLGDLDGDGITELAVGSVHGNCTNTGEVHVLFLQSDGTVRGQTSFCGPPGGIVGLLDSFGRALAALGDVDGDGIPDLAVGATGDDEGGTDVGAIWIVFLRANGQPRTGRKIGALRGGFGGPLDERDSFGSGLARLGDLDGDGAFELAVGAPGDDDGHPDAGAVWILSVDADRSVRSERKLSLGQGGFTGPLASSDAFGTSVAALGDIDGDGVGDLAVGAPGAGKGAVWILCLEPDGTVKAQRLTRQGVNGFTGPLPARLDPQFGAGVAALGDLDGDGLMDLAVGTPNYLDPSYPEPSGETWLLSLDGIVTVDFEHESDLVTTLVNGQDVSTPAEFRGPFALSSSGANLGPAIFDSAPLGPNDPSQDLDLLVGSGNVLILQNSQAPTQTAPGVFDRPNDDQDGGRFRFAFDAPVELAGLDLVDIDTGATQFAHVTLIDASGRRRDYLVPAGWTGDRQDDATSGLRTLDLTTLAPQPGFASTASASETPGFEPRAVVLLEVQLGSSGALDDVRFDPHPGP